MINAVSLKGVNGNVILKLDPNVSFEEIVTQIRKLVSEQRTFFSHGSLNIDTQGRVLSEDEIATLDEIFGDIGVSFKINEVEHVSKEPPKLGKNVLIVEHTVRSGQVVKFDGDIVVLGNINPGSEVETPGDLYVFGSIKGSVKAGRRVVALGFNAASMEIGGILTDYKTDERSKKPRIAEVDKELVSFKLLEEREVKPVKRGRNG